MTADTTTINAYAKSDSVNISDPVADIIMTDRRVAVECLKSIIRCSSDDALRLEAARLLLIL